MFESIPILLIAITLTLGTLFLAGIILRAIGAQENPTLLAFVPAQMHSLVVTKSEKNFANANDSSTQKDGGNLVNVIHSIPGKVLNKSSKEPMDWVYEDESPEKKEFRGLLFQLLGLQWVGVFRYLRLNDVRTFRYGLKGTDKQEENEAKYHVMAKREKTRNVFFSGQHDVFITEIETTGILSIDLLLNILYEEKYPVRVRLRTADPYAVLTMMATNLVISHLGGKDPREFINNKDREQDELIEKIESLSSLVEMELGIKIKKVSIADICFNAETRKLLELQERTRLENLANIAKATNAKEVQILTNDADADRVERVIKPAAENNRTVAVRVAEAYERNLVVTTFAPGANTMIPLGK